MKRALTLLLAVLALGAGALAQSTPCTNGFTQVSTAPITGTTFTDSTVTDGNTYVYMITANNAAGFACSGVSTQLPIPSTGVHSVALSWIASTTSGVTYAVFRAQNPAPSGTPSGTVN